jgi:hypothetical protein
MSDADDVYTQEVTLAAGGRFSRLQVAEEYKFLSSFLEYSDSEWNLLYYLRQLVLGNEIEEDQKHALINENILEPDGTVRPITESVVVSALRGMDRNLYFDSPYATAHDRTLGDLITARLSLEDDPLIRQVFERSPDPIQRIVDNLKKESAADPIDAFKLAQQLLKQNPPNPDTQKPSSTEEKPIQGEGDENRGSSPNDEGTDRRWTDRNSERQRGNGDLPDH